MKFLFTFAFVALIYLAEFNVQSSPTGGPYELRSSNSWERPSIYETRSWQTPNAYRTPSGKSNDLSATHSQQTPRSYGTPSSQTRDSYRTPIWKQVYSTHSGQNQATRRIQTKRPYRNERRHRTQRIGHVEHRNTPSVKVTKNYLVGTRQVKR